MESQFSRRVREQFTKILNKSLMRKNISANCKAIIACVANPSQTQCKLCTSRKKCKYFQYTNSYLNLRLNLLSFFIFMNVSCTKDDLITFHFDFSLFRKLFFKNCKKVYHAFKMHFLCKSCELTC